MAAEFVELMGAAAVGAAASFLPSYYFEGRRERAQEGSERGRHDREREAADRKLRGEVRQAARMIYSELLQARLTVDGIVDSRLWWMADDWVRLTSWEEYGPVLAAALSKRDFDTLSAAWLTILQLQTWRSEALAGQDYGLDDTAVTGAKHCLAAIDAAGPIVNRLTSDDPELTDVA